MRLLWSELKRLLFSLAFCCCTLGAAILFMISLRFGVYRDAVDAFILAWTFSDAAMLIVLMPNVIRFATDWELKTHVAIILRTGTRRYVICKLLSMQIGIILGCVLSKLICMAYVCVTRAPLYDAAMYNAQDYQILYMGDLLRSGRPYLFMAAQIVRNAIGYLFIGTCSICLTVCYPKRMFAVITPVIVYYGINYCAMLPAADYLYSAERAIQYSAWFSGSHQYTPVLLMYLLGSFVMSGLFIFGARRRLAHA